MTTPAPLPPAPASTPPLADWLRLEGGEVAGCALVAGELAHLTAFPAASTGLP